METWSRREGWGGGQTGSRRPLPRASQKRPDRASATKGGSAACTYVAKETVTPPPPGDQPLRLCGRRLCKEADGSLETLRFARGVGNELGPSPRAVRFVNAGWYMRCLKLRMPTSFHSSPFLPKKSFRKEKQRHKYTETDRWTYLSLYTHTEAHIYRGYVKAGARICKMSVREISVKLY